MIFYFTGTGNSGFIAQQLSGITGERIFEIPKEIHSKVEVTYVVEKGETIGFVFPVYAWAAPDMVTQFIEKINLQYTEKPYVYGIATCGANIGNTMGKLQKTLAKKGLSLNSGFSIVMPNNYIVASEVDSKEEQERKIQEGKAQLTDILKVIERKEDGYFEIVKGPIPAMLTAVVNPLFNKFAISTKKFYVTEDCTGCGLCEQICATQTITVQEKPKWGKDCTQCLGCINICPTQAIQFGKGTEKRGRYYNPYYVLDKK